MNDIIQLTQKFIKLRSCTTENANIAIHEIVAILKRANVEYEILENQGHLMLAAWVGEGERTLILNGHIDVVPGNKQQYEPYIDDGKLYGRGSYDMIGACATMITLLCELANNPPKVRVVLTISTTEETNGALCTKYILDKGYIGDFAICGEPTNLRISVMSKGVFRIKINVIGKSAHSSRPWLGENAILKAIEIFHKIELLPFAQRKNEYFDCASINLSHLNGGIVLNQVPDLSEMIIDIRYVPGYEPHDILSEINSIEGNFSVEVISTGSAVMVDENNEYLEMLMRVTQSKLEDKNVLTAQHGAADTMFFQEKGIPSVEFGPIGAGHHGSQEFVCIESLEKYQSILIDFIKELELTNKTSIEYEKEGGIYNV